MACRPTFLIQNEYQQCLIVSNWILNAKIFYRNASQIATKPNKKVTLDVIFHFFHKTGITLWLQYRKGRTHVLLLDDCNAVQRKNWLDLNMALWAYVWWLYTI